MFACLDQTDFIHFCSYTLNLCLKFTRINKSCSLSEFTGRPRMADDFREDGPVNTRRLGSLEKIFYFGEYLAEGIYSGVVRRWIRRMNESYFGIDQKRQFGSFLSWCGSGSWARSKINYQISDWQQFFLRSLTWICLLICHHAHGCLIYHDRTDDRIDFFFLGFDHGYGFV